MRSLFGRHRSIDNTTVSLDQPMDGALSRTDQRVAVEHSHVGVEVHFRGDCVSHAHTMRTPVIAGPWGIAT